MTNYEKGRRREYQVMRALEAAGFYCIRAAGSHGLFDVVAIGPNELRLIQVKANQMASPAEQECLREFDLGPEGTSKYIWLYVNGQRKPIVHRIN